MLFLRYSFCASVGKKKNFDNIKTHGTTVKVIFVAVCASYFNSTLNSPTAQIDMSLIFVGLHPSTVFENKALLFVPYPRIKE